MELLLKKFAHWMRSVDGLTAKTLPKNEPLPQGGLTTHIRQVQVETADWVEKAELGPPARLNIWTTLDGRARVDVLYRGVFVQRHEAQGLWAIEGCLHVDPKHFKPSLNRERFIGPDFAQQVDAFLRSAHPRVLLKALDGVRQELSSAPGREWGIRRWVTLWLAVPRSEDYGEVAKAWDNEFWERKAFLLKGEKDTEVSLADISRLQRGEIYVAPLDTKRNPLVSGAMKVLRAKGLAIIQGIQRDPGYLAFAPIARHGASDSLLSHFRDRLPKLVHIEEIAEASLSSGETVAELFSAPTKARVMRLGQDAAAIVKVRDEIWINGDSEAGKNIIRDTCDRNEGYVGLLVACQVHAPGHLPEIAGLLAKPQKRAPILGPVKRQYLRAIAK